MPRHWIALALLGATLLAACAAPPPEPPVQNVAVVSAPVAVRVPAATAVMPPMTLESYKREFARKVASASPEVFDDPLPEILKSVVVLDVTVGRDGQLVRVAVRRSNGYRALETLAMDSVRHAAPYGAPDSRLQRADGSISFLETFLFRDDGRFRIRSQLD